MLFLVQNETLVDWPSTRSMNTCRVYRPLMFIAYRRPAVVQDRACEMESEKMTLTDVAKMTFMKLCDVIEGRALQNIGISRAKLVQIVEQSRVLCEDYVYCRLQVC